jgi:hypothetical protein
MHIIFKRLPVYFVFVFEIVQTAMTGADMYFWFAAGFGNVLELANSQLSPIDIPFFVAFMSLIVQSFFAYRIYTIKKSFWFAVGAIVIVSHMLSFESPHHVLRHLRSWHSCRLGQASA